MCNLPDKHRKPSFSAFCLLAASSERSTTVGKTFVCPRTGGWANEMCALYHDVALRMAGVAYSSDCMSQRICEGRTSIVPVIGRFVFVSNYSSRSAYDSE